MTAKFALIIGNQQYEDPLLKGLHAPEYDVNDLAGLLEDPQIGGFAVTRLLDRTFVEIRSAISDFLTDRRSEDTILLYFSGHGIKSRSGTVYLAVRDTRQKNPAVLGIDAHFLRNEMQQCYSQRQILILDCCYSGAFAKIGKGIDTVDTKSEFMSGFGQVVITATNAVQVGIEADRVVGDSKHSLFTHYLIEGLRTGQADGAGGAAPDGVITDLELYEYAYRRVDATKEQIPQRLVQQFGPPIEIAKNPYFVAQKVEAERPAAENAERQSAGLPVAPVFPPDPAPLSEGARVLDTFVSPSKTFTDLRRSAAWWVPWLLISISSLALAFAMERKVGFEQVTRNQFASSSGGRFDKLSTEQQTRQISLSSKILRFTSYGSPVVSLFSFFLMTTAVWTTFKIAAGAKTPFKTAYAIMVYGSLPSIVEAALGINTLLVGIRPEVAAFNKLVGVTNLAFYLDPATTGSFIREMASTVDVLSIWKVVLMGIGFSCTSKVKRSTAISIMATLFVLYKLMTALIAASGP